MDQGCQSGFRKVEKCKKCHQEILQMEIQTENDHDEDSRKNRRKREAETAGSLENRGREKEGGTEADRLEEGRGNG